MIKNFIPTVPRKKLVEFERTMNKFSSARGFRGQDFKKYLAYYFFKGQFSFS